MRLPIADQRLAHPLFGQQAGNHFDEPHQRHRIEEMKSGEPLRRFQFRRDRRHRHRRRVGGEYAIGRDDVFELAEHLALDVEVLHHRFDDRVAGLEFGQRVDDFDARRGGRRIFLAHAAFFRRAREHLRRRNRALPRRRRRACPSSIRCMPPAAATCTIPRPMAPVPSTPIVRSGRFASNFMSSFVAGSVIEMLLPAGYRHYRANVRKKRGRMRSSTAPSRPKIIPEMHASIAGRRPASPSFAAGGKCAARLVDAARMRAAAH